MPTRPQPALVVLALASSLAACVSLKRTPEARFFVLRPLAEPEPAGADRPPRGLVGVLPVQLPGYLDRPQLVTWTAPDELRIDEFLRWAEPLDAGVSRTLAENLDNLLGDLRVIRAPWPSAARLAYRVRVRLTLFGPQADGDVRLEGRWGILPPKDERPLLARSVSLRHHPPAGAAAPGPFLGVEAMSQLLAELSAQVAEGLRSLPAPE